MVPNDFNTAHAEVVKLVKTFDDSHDKYLAADYNESAARKDFIDKFFIALGWDEASRKYREWKKQSEIAKPGFDDESIEELDDSEREQEMALDEIEALALEGITKSINSKTPYEFQDLAAALLRAMGYFTPFVAPRGKDGGVDIVAYRDPLGTESPRIKVQIKHRESSTAVQDVRQLMGLLQKDGDVGIFFSTGGFTPDAKSTARGSHVPS